MVQVRGSTVIARGPSGADETWAFASEAEAQAKARFVAEALSWIGTPFRDCADVKGPNGAVDCAMLLTRAAVDAGLRPPFDPRPYAPRWHVHRDEQKFLDWIETKLGGRRVEKPRFGDVIVWQFGRCFSHGAVLINSEEIVHAYAHARMCVVSRLDEHPLNYVGKGSCEFRRPVRYYDVWCEGSDALTPP